MRYRHIFKSLFLLQKITIILKFDNMISLLYRISCWALTFCVCFVPWQSWPHNLLHKMLVKFILKCYGNTFVLASTQIADECKAEYFPSGKLMLENKKNWKKLKNRKSTANTLSATIKLQKQNFGYFASDVSPVFPFIFQNKP